MDNYIDFVLDGTDFPMRPKAFYSLIKDNTKNKYHFQTYMDYIIYKFILPKIVQNFSCNICVKVSYLLLSYIGYFLFLTLISSIFLLPAPELNYYIVYYIVIEFFLVSLL